MDKPTIYWQNFARVGLQAQVCFQNTAITFSLNIVLIVNTTVLYLRC